MTIWVVALLAILFGPIVWALTAGASGGTPNREDALGSTGWFHYFKDRHRDPQQ